MDEILPHRHSQPRVMCAWSALGFLLQTNIATLDEILPHRRSQPRNLYAWSALGFLLQTNIAILHVGRA
jgi:hypothetical protein